jgi:hypothetical protein
LPRLEKVLQQAGIKLTNTASEAYSKSSRTMLEAPPAGVSDPHALANLAKKRTPEKIPQLREALQGRIRRKHREPDRVPRRLGL